MPSFTKEQLDAINKENTNIIVSAGAGSGKTAVLTERVIRKLKEGIDVDKLLVLTFTKAAALEMKDRIKQKIKKETNLTDQLDKISSSYITTFDSYSLSVVKKYHYLLNITPNVKICESTIIEIKKKEFLEEIFNNLYKSKNNQFLKLIDDFCLKDDDTVKNNILNIYNKIDMKYDKINYLKTYIEENFNEEKIEADIKEYESLLIGKINNIKLLLEDISNYVDGTYYNDLYNQLSNLLNSKNYNDIITSFPDKLKSLPKNSIDRVKQSKEKISKTIKEIKDLYLYNNREETKNIVYLTKDYIEIIINIILELNNKLDDYKKENDLFEFIDIARLAIKVVDENIEVREEIRDYFNEILVDEYQDTNDLQEMFISLISNNNVYMVGDIKQSIYRFRNANPDIFKNKYDNYSKNIGGIKIDLNKNFRSRREVLDNINHIFDKVMDNFLGGAEYQETHRMIFGNTTYEEDGFNNQDNNLEIYNYEYDKLSQFSKEEIEIFIIANDIKEKIDNHYKVYDKDNNILRDITYKDFVILMDRAKDFDLYKKIFEYLHIPLTIYKDSEINTSVDMKVLSNILKLLIKIKDNNFDQEFIYSFTSVYRSFLYNEKDEIIFDYITNKTYKESDLYKKILSILSGVSYNSSNEIINIILKEFDYYNKLLTITNINSSIDRIDYLKTITKNISSMGYTIYDLSNIIDEILNNDLLLTIPNNNIDNNSCKIMTIHKSKGLEYHVCYFSGLYKKFNISDLKDKFMFDNKYGIISPYYNEGIGETIYKLLLKDKYLKEEISEKIRLFYVSLTRCKEKMIFINSFNDEEETIYKDNHIVNDTDRLKYRSFKDILDSIEQELLIYKKDIDLNKLNLTKEYNFNKNNKYLEKTISSDKKLIIKENNFIFKDIENKSFSKNTNHLLQKDTITNMEYGEKMHYYLELLNLKTKDLSFINDQAIKDKLNNFLNLDILEDIEEANIYKEYEFIYEVEANISHGIIDLLIEHDDRVFIVDYKLSNIDDDAYVKQLNGYKKFIENKLNKKTYIYLYSINNNILKEIS